MQSVMNSEENQETQKMEAEDASETFVPSSRTTRFLDSSVCIVNQLQVERLRNSEFSVL